MQLLEREEGTSGQCHFPTPPACSVSFLSESRRWDDPIGHLPEHLRRFHVL